MAKLTERQRKFVLFYEGDATKAAIKAGYSPKTARAIGSENLTKPYIREALLKKAEQNEAPDIADITERKVILTGTARDGDPNESTKAVDVLNKMDAVYIQKQEITHNFQGKPKEEVIQMAIKELESLGYKVIPPK